MAYNLPILIQLGEAFAGRNDITVDILDTAGAVVTADVPVTVDLGNGDYSLVRSFADTFQGYVKVYAGGDYTKAAFAINPAELGFLADGAITDAKFTIPAEGTHTGPVGWMRRLYRRFYNRVVRDSSTIKVYRNNGTTVDATSIYTSDNVNEDVAGAT